MGPHGGVVSKTHLLIVVKTFNTTTHRIRSYDPMALRLIHKVLVLFAPRASTGEEAQSITTSFMHLSLLLSSPTRFGGL